MVGALAGNGRRSWVYGGHQGCQVEAWDLSEGRGKLRRWQVEAADGSDRGGERFAHRGRKGRLVSGVTSA